MAEWPIRAEKLSNLILDPRNVRVRAGRGDGLGAAERAAAEKAILKYMVEAEDLLTLARDILRDGYLDNEIPVVAGEGKQFVVLEGNRRITALKVIADPALLGDWAARVERLVSRYPDHESPTTIRVMVAPSRDAAQPLLARLHTGNPKKGWIREQQAIFFHAQLADDTNVDALRVMYPAEAAKIPRFISMGEMRDVIRAMTYKDAALRAFVINSELKMTGFEYAYRPKKLHTALGLEFDQDGLLSSKRLSNGQQRALTYLLGRFKEDTLNTRSRELIAKYPEHDEFVELLRRMVASEPDPPASDVSGGHAGGGWTVTRSSAVQSASQGGGLSAEGAAEDAGGKAGESSSANAGTGARGPNRGDTKSRLDTDGFEYRGSSGGMRRRFEELGRLDVRDYPNAAHDLLRTVLECAIKDYFRAKGQPMDEKLTIGPCVAALARDLQANKKMTTLINAINRRGAMSAAQNAGTHQSLNASNHEPDHFVVAKDVHEAWDRIKPIVIEIVGTPPAEL